MESQKFPTVSERLALLEEAERSAHLGSWIWNIQEQSVYWSDEFFRILGLDPAKDEATFEGFFQAIHPEDLPGVQADSEYIARTGQGRVRVLRIIRKDGAERTVRLSSSQVADEAGVPTRMVGILLDVTDDVVKEEALQSALSRMNEAQRLAKVGSWVLDLNSGEMEWSDEMHSICGSLFRGKCLELTDLEQVIQTEDRELFRQFLEAAQTSPQNVECRLSTEVHRRNVAFQARLEGSPGESKRMLHGTMMDLTERKNLEAQLRQSQKMEALGRLAGGVAHDLNNYLQIISGNIELIEPEEPSEDPDVQAAQADIRTSLKLCAALTRGLLAFSRQQSMEPKAVDLHEVILHSVGLLEKLLGGEITTQTDLKASQSIVHCDPHQLEQVVFNLAVNARDAMAGVGTLTFSTSNTTDRTGELSMISVEVRDTGHGMTEEVAARAFDPFFSTKPPGHGTGLGLSAVYGIVEQAGGHISVVSEPDVGTTFTLVLPLREDVPEEEGCAVTPPTPPLRQRAPCILVAEDEPMVRRMTARSLRHAGFDVLEAADGRQALEILTSPEGERIALVLSDIIMPNLGGIELVETMKRRGLTTPLVLMTGYADQQKVERSAASEKRILNKPFSRDALLEAIEEAIDKRA